MKRFVLYCRSGFEKDCAAEALENFSSLGWDGYAETHGETGLVSFHAEPFADDAPELSRAPYTKNFVFARHILEHAKHIKGLPDNDRASPLAALAMEISKDKKFRDIILEHPDTNEGREMASFCKKFLPAMTNALKRAGGIFDKGQHRSPALHICFLNYQEAFIGLSWKERSGPWKSGLPRLKFPHEAPSRSTLKLEEAFLGMMSEKERQNLFATGGTAVDLGAAPGGWTYQLLQKGFYVTAVDNGDMAPSLASEAMLDHVKQDGFRFKPKHKVDLLVCDMVDKPQKVAELISRWFQEGLCSWAVCNLKLPMKKRFQELQAILDQLADDLGEEKWEFRCKQLYHDREEVTLLMIPYTQVRT